MSFYTEFSQASPLIYWPNSLIFIIKSLKLFQRRKVFSLNLNLLECQVHVTSESHDLDWSERRDYQWDASSANSYYQHPICTIHPCTSTSTVLCRHAGRKEVSYASTITGCEWLVNEGRFRSLKSECRWTNHGVHFTISAMLNWFNPQYFDWPRIRIDSFVNTMSLKVWLSGILKKNGIQATWFLLNLAPILHLANTIRLDFRIFLFFFLGVYANQKQCGWTTPIAQTAVQHRQATPEQLFYEESCRDHVRCAYIYYDETWHHWGWLKFLRWDWLEDAGIMLERLVELESLS